MGFISNIKRTPSDFVSFIFMVLAIHWTVLYEFLVILPYIERTHDSHYGMHAVFGFCLYLNVIGALYKAASTNSTSGSVVLPSILKPGWRFCSICESNSPPRSHHCHICDRCILKRDHHCMFTGSCVGHKNHRYFMQLMLFTGVGATYCCYLNMDYTFEVLGGLGIKTVFGMFMPLLAWAFGVIPGYSLMVALISSLCLVGSLMLAVFFFYHFTNICNGQTMHERSHNIHIYDLGWRENVIEVFGVNWKYAWISPFLDSPLPSEGIEPRTRAVANSVKAM